MIIKCTGSNPEVPNSGRTVSRQRTETPRGYDPAIYGRGLVIPLKLSISLTNLAYIIDLIPAEGKSL